MGTLHPVSFQGARGGSDEGAAVAAEDLSIIVAMTEVEDLAIAGK
jgi:hypothetical protein